MDSLSGVISGILRRHGLEQGVIDYDVFARWEEIAGNLSRRTKPLRVQEGTLWVHVENSSLIQHMGFLAPKIMQRIRDEVPGTSIRRLKFTLRKVEFRG